MARAYSELTTCPPAAGLGGVPGEHARELRARDTRRRGGHRERYVTVARPSSANVRCCRVLTRDRGLSLSMSRASLCRGPDVHVSLDDVVLMFHDPSAFSLSPRLRDAVYLPRSAALERTTNGKGEDGCVGFVHESRTDASGQARLRSRTGTVRMGCNTSGRRPSQSSPSLPSRRRSSCS